MRQIKKYITTLAVTMIASLTASLSCYSQILPDSIKRNIIEVGIRYDSLSRLFLQTIQELEQRENQINQLTKVLESERALHRIEREKSEQSLLISKDALGEAFTKIRQLKRKKLAFGAQFGYGIGNNGLGVNIGIGLTYIIFRF